MLPNPQKIAGLVTFTGKILIVKLHFLYSLLKLKSGNIKRLRDFRDVVLTYHKNDSSLLF